MFYQLFITAIAAFLLVSPAHPQDDPKKAIFEKNYEFWKAANRAILNEKFDDAVEIYQKQRRHLKKYRQHFLTQSDDYPKNWDIAQLIAINRFMAIATAKSKKGEPCEALAEANKYWIDLKMMPADPKEVSYDYILSLEKRQIHNSIIEFDCIGKIAKSADEKLAGTYYLTGVMETGAGLRLKKDGNYDWFFSVGGLDLSSSGKWHQMGDAIQMVDRKKAPKIEVITSISETKFVNRKTKFEDTGSTENNPNYAIQFDSAEDGISPPTAFITFSYADGDEEVDFAVNGEGSRIEKRLDSKRLPIAVTLTFNRGAETIEQKVDLKPRPGIMHRVKVRDIRASNIAITSFLLRIDGDKLYSPRGDDSGVYVKSGQKR